MKKTLRLLSIAAMLLLLAVSCKKEEEVVSPCLCFTAQERNSTVSMVGHELNLLKLETSTDGIKWEPFFPEETTITLKHKGDKVYFRGDNPDGLSNRNRRANFVMSGKIAASGNVMSLLDPTCQMTVIPSEYCFWGLFLACKSLTKAPELPATNLADSCYYSMFEECTSLTTAPELPATNLAIACYEDMFYLCTNLTTAPELPATSLANECYRGMFLACKSLTTAPELPATNLVDKCYYSMFQGCTSLTTAPELPATNLAEGCYNMMFYSCINLKTAPVLPATILTFACYEWMFNYCISLNEIEVHFIDWKEDIFATKEWFFKVNTAGTFRCPSELLQKFGESNIPEGWSVETF